MNVGRKFSMQRFGAVLALCLCGAGMTAAGCGDLRRATNLTPPPVNPESPVAPAVAAAAARNYPLPNLRSVPSPPADVPTAEGFKNQVVGLVGERRQMERWDVTHPPMTSNPAAYAAKAESQLPALELPPANQAAISSAYAEKMRAEGAAPPPIGGPSGPIVVPAMPASLPAPPESAPKPTAPKGKPAKKPVKKYKLPPPPASAPRKPG